MTDNPLTFNEITAADIGDAEADAEEREHDLLRAVLTGLAVFLVLQLRWQFRGRPVDDLDLLDALAREEQERGLDLYAAFTAGQIDIARWLNDMATNLRRFHLQASAIGRGGFDYLTDADFQRLGDFLQAEFGYLEGFAAELGGLSEAQAAQRLQLYHNHAQSVYWEARQETHLEIGFSECRRQLNPAEHCGDCINYAAMDWQPIGTLPPPGQESECRTNCKCTMEFR